MFKLSELCGKFFDFPEVGASIGADLPCFNKALQTFLNGGKKEDAFTVYFCFNEIFKLFGEGYDNVRKLMETLSDHEYHSGGLLTKHRDHYSHSVYVFALGLAVYANDKTYRSAFTKFYGGISATDFLRLWGAVSLFHDIGYPFQFAHEQIKNYTQELWGDGQKPYVSYGNMREFLAVSPKIAEEISKTLGIQKPVSSINGLLAFGLEKRMGYNPDYISYILKKRVEVQPRFMDHGYFGAVILAGRLLNNGGFKIDLQWLDVLTAILLHNNLNKYDLEKSHAVKKEEHPLAYLLILCDELQNWDRLAFGKASKRDPIAWDAEFSITDNSIKANYIFDCRFVEDYSSGVLNLRPNKSFSKIENGGFVADIYGFIDTGLAIEASAKEKSKRRRAEMQFSEESFISLLDFAKAIHASYGAGCQKMGAEHINSEFATLPLEFKVSNIEQAKSYAYKLKLINCFYSEKDLDYPVVENFNALNADGGRTATDFLCREEHVRWVKEKLALGWNYGTGYKTNEERNLKKIHKDIVPYEVLSPKEREKDAIMINNVIPLLRRFGNNIKIYNCYLGAKPCLTVAGAGHRFFKENRENLKNQIKNILAAYAKDYRVTVKTCYAAGADMLIAECACELGLNTEAVLPMEYEEYINDVIRDGKTNGNPLSPQDISRLRGLLAQTFACEVVPDPEFAYCEASKYLISKCDKLIALWDGKELPLQDKCGAPVNLGGTYHSICLAKERGLKEGEDIHIVRCSR